jgi:hypothetical protein
MLARTILILDVQTLKILQIDFLANLLERFHKVAFFEETVFQMEFSAYVEVVLWPYSHSVDINGTLTPFAINWYTIPLKLLYIYTKAFIMYMLYAITAEKLTWHISIRL